MKSFILFLIGISHIPHASAIFEYDRAIAQAQKGNWQKSRELLTHVVVDTPHNPQALYDLGISSYKTNQFDTALSYFNQAASKASLSNLKEQAYFNAGNAHVELKQLQEAIDAYDKVLAINPANERAKHNKELVKKMLEEQQKKEQEKKQNEDKKKEDEQKKENDKNNNDKDNREKNPDQHNKNQDNKDEQNDKQQEQEQNKKDNEESQKKEQQDKQEKSQQDKKQEKSENKESQNGQQDDKQNKQAMSNEQKEAASEKKQIPLSPALERMLQEREKKDAQLNKKMIKAMAASSKGAANDYNCW